MFIFISLHYRERIRAAQFKIAALEERDASDDAAYWLKYPGTVPDKTERLWDALLEGLDKYR